MNRHIVKIFASIVIGLTFLTLNAQSVPADNPLSDGNVWIVEDGTKYFTCPVNMEEKKVTQAKAYSIFDGKKYYHCCPSSQGPFRSNPEKYLADFVIYGNVIKVDEEGRKHFRDPVSRNEGIVKSKTLYFDYNGHRYFFTKKKTKKEFAFSPTDYI